MQGVDRVDQLRTRFSIADGHSFKIWYIKLAVGIIDLVRVNAYCARQNVIKYEKTRDPHRTFVSNLAAQLIRGNWMHVPSNATNHIPSSPSVSSGNESETWTY